MARRDALPDWLSDKLILSELAERELRDRSLFVRDFEPPLPALSLKEFVHEFWEVLEPGTPMAWVWAELNPSERFLAVDFTESLALRRLLLSSEYVVRYGDTVQLTRDNNAKGEYDALARGRRAVRLLTAATGVRASILLIDDPNNAVEIHSPAHRRTSTTPTTPASAGVGLTRRSTCRSASCSACTMRTLPAT